MLTGIACKLHQEHCATTTDCECTAPHAATQLVSHLFVSLMQAAAQLAIGWRHPTDCGPSHTIPPGIVEVFGLTAELDG